MSPYTRIRQFCYPIRLVELVGVHCFAEGLHYLKHHIPAVHQYFDRPTRIDNIEKGVNALSLHSHFTMVALTFVQPTCQSSYDRTAYPGANRTCRATFYIGHLSATI
jgi:hypothetical protein